MRAKLVGLRQALRALDEFKEGVRKRQTTIALSAAAGVLKVEAGRLAPRQTGLLSKSMGVQVRYSKDGAIGRVGVKRGIKRAVVVDKKGVVKAAGAKRSKTLDLSGVKTEWRSPSRYAHLVALGTKAHRVTAKDARVLASRGQIFGRSVMVRGVRANNFYAQAVANKSGEAVAKAKTKLAVGVESERRKAHAKASGK